MKKLLSLFLTIAMLLGCLSFVACDNNPGSTSGEDRQVGLICEIEEDDDGNKYAVATKYSISEEASKKVLNNNYADIMEDLVIDTYEYEGETYPIKEISANCFSNQAVIKSIKFSNKVEKFGSACLSGCINLQSLEVPFVGATVDAKNAQKVLGYLFGSAAVEGCSTISMKYNETGTQAYAIPNSLKEVTVTGDKLSDYAFYGMNLEKVNLTGNVTAISSFAFAEMQSLKAYEIPAKVTAIGKGAFKNCINLAKLDFSKATALTAIGSEAFSGCELLGYGKINNLSLPKTLETLGEKAFYNCKNLKALDLSTTKLTLVSSYTFYGCVELAQVKLADGTELSLGAFGKCENLSKNEFAAFKGVDYAFDLDAEDDVTQGAAN